MHRRLRVGLDFEGGAMLPGRRPRHEIYARVGEVGLAVEFVSEVDLAIAHWRICGRMYLTDEVG